MPDKNKGKNDKPIKQKKKPIYDEAALNALKEMDNKNTTKTTPVSPGKTKKGKAGETPQSLTTKPATMKTRGGRKLTPGEVEEINHEKDELVKTLDWIDEIEGKKKKALEKLNQELGTAREKLDKTRSKIRGISNPPPLLDYNPDSKDK